MKSYIEYHINSCAYCVAKRSAAAPVGSAIRTKRRLKLVEFDHKKLEASVVAATGLAAILTVVDPVARVTMFILMSQQLILHMHCTQGGTHCLGRHVSCGWTKPQGTPLRSCRPTTK